MKRSKALWAAAMAGIVSAAGMAHPASVRADDAKGKAEDGKHKCSGKEKCTGKSKCNGMTKSEDAQCYGVNKCKGTGKCGGVGSAGCAGTNSCKGMGWLPMPKDSCLAIEGGALEPKKG